MQGIAVPYRRTDRFPRRGERDPRIADGEGPGCGFGLALQRPRKALAQGAAGRDGTLRSLKREHARIAESASGPISDMKSAVAAQFRMYDALPEGPVILNKSFREVANER